MMHFMTNFVLLHWHGLLLMIILFAMILLLCLNIKNFWEMLPRSNNNNGLSS